MPGVPMKTLSLTNDWDLSLDSTGNLVVLNDRAAILQDVCSAARTWLGEVIYDTGQGIPYDTDILRSDVDLSFYASEIEDAAMSVPGVAAATCHLANPTKDRQLTGVILVTFSDGSMDHAQF
ncbi:hypothetical protein NQF87_08495 [Bombella sp. TMW 2.2559]|uniref:Uncharacterized protein n=1 Tax=Bombella dulcis TaxID=2967339 RepID=A0ABT3WD41_9PROT|nr:hypothetical protein [Bombella dulcis]MCX5617005.1 hypothetical protein [Bombella dulcis]